MAKNICSDFIVLVFSGKKLNPNRITQKIGIDADTQAQKGGFSTGTAFSSGQIPKSHQKSKTGFWTFGTNRNKTIADQFSWITKKFKKCRKALIEIMSWDSLELSYIEIVVKPSAQDGIYSCVLRAKDLEFWSSIGIDVAYSCWVPGWDKDIEK